MRNHKGYMAIWTGIILCTCSLLSVFITLTGCSGDDDDNTPTYTSTPTVTATVTATSTPTPAYFIKTYGGEGFELASAAAVLDSERYLIAGTTDSFGAGKYDFYLIVVDGSGEVVWWTTAGGPGDDWCDDVLVTESGQIFAVGYTDSWGSGEHDILLIAFDSNGNQLWQRTYGGLYEDFGSGIVAADDGNYVLCGFTDLSGNGYSDMLMIKIDSSGNQLWSNTFGGSLGDFAMDVIRTNDGGFLLGGNSFSFSSIPYKDDCYFVKTDASGNQIWGAIAGGSDKDECFNLLQLDNGQYLFSGFSYQTLYTNDAFIGSLGNNGAIIWSDFYGGPRYETAFATIQVSSHELVSAGYTDSSGYGYGDVSLRKLSESGSELWHRTIGFEGEEVGYDLIETTDQGYLIVGTTNSVGAGLFDLLIVKTDNEGKIE